MKFDHCFLVVDVETGGIPSLLNAEAVTQVALVEIAIIAVDNISLEIVDKKSWVIKPYADDLIYTKEAAAVCGMDRDFCEKNGLEMKDVFKEFLAFTKQFTKGRKKPILVGHNIQQFDLEFIINFFKLNKNDASKFYNEYVADTLDYSRLKWPNSINYKLATCCQNANITLANAHKALIDTIATAKLWSYFVKCLRSESTETVEKSVSQKDIKKDIKIW